MADWDLTICGLDGLGRQCRPGVTHIVSILDPDRPDPAAVRRYPADRRLTLRFDDIEAPSRWFAAPKPGHVELLLAFGRRLPIGTAGHLLIHCHAGISRSTAAAAALLMQAHPDAEEDEIFAHIARIRPQACPNARIIAFADEILGRDGRLIAAARRFQARNVAALPRLPMAAMVGDRLPRLAPDQQAVAA